MELVKELFVTGFIALVLSFLVAKIVTIFMSSDDPVTPAAVRDADVAEPEQEDLLAADELQVRGAEAEEVVTATVETTSELVEAGIEEGDRDGVRERELEIEDDWEGIERSEVEEAFEKAARLLVSGEEEARLAGEEFQLELYGLYKVATEGPCRENPPLPLKLSARSKWNAWQRLGNMTPDYAMEKYVALVSERVPGWLDEKTNRDSEARSSGAADASLLGLDSATVSSSEINVTNERNAEPRPDPVKCDSSEELCSESRVRE